MLHATEILGAETYDSAGNFVGRVKEMFIEPADQPNRVARLLLGTRTRTTAEHKEDKGRRKQNKNRKLFHGED